MPQPTVAPVSVVAADEGHKAALDLNAVWTENAGLIGRVGRFKGDRSALAAQAFERGFFTIDQGDDDIARIGGFGAAQDDQIAFQDSGFDHRVAFDLEREVLFALGQVVGGRDVAIVLLDRRDGHTGGNAAKDRDGAGGTGLCRQA